MLITIIIICNLRGRRGGPPLAESAPSRRSTMSGRNAARRSGVLLAVLFSAPGTHALDDGLARRPPMGWRSWNTFYGHVTQELMVQMMDLVAARDRHVDGEPTSLLDLGYGNVGLDDGWQLCGKYGPEGFTFHDALGSPIVNRSRFPDFEALTAHAHAQGLTAGWYLNNCICSDSCAATKCYRGDIVALTEFGFDGVKLDGCSGQWDLDMYARMIKATGRPVVIENCHWGRTLPNATWCPFHFYRTSTDIRPWYASVVANLQTVWPLASSGLSAPGCWAYPDMLELGCPNGSLPGLSLAESRAHFGAWCIVSSPLILSHDLRDRTTSDALWPIISNREAIAVNQAWAGHSGTVFQQAAERVLLAHPKGVGDAPVDVPAWQYLYKPLDEGGARVAVLLMNHASSASDLRLAFGDVPGLACAAATGGKCAVRDVWRRADVGVFGSQETYVAKHLEAHDAAFLIVSTA